MPPNEAPRIIDALAPNGIVVFEGPGIFVPTNGLAKTFDRLSPRSRRSDGAPADYGLVRILTWTAATICRTHAVTLRRENKRQ